MKISLVSLLAAFAPLLAAAAPAPQAEGISAAAAVYSNAAVMGIDLTKAPAWEPIPELGLEPIKTGTNLPTLQDLNLMWSDLVRERDESSRATAPSASEVTSGVEAGSSLTRRQSYTCQAGVMVNVSYADACWAYLLGLGSTACIVVMPDEQFCESNGVYWTGYTHGEAWVSTPCSNVANHGDYLLESCKKWHYGFLYWEFYAGRVYLASIMSLRIHR